MDRYLRTEALLGRDALLKLRDSRVLVFGVGGVGGYVVEALARSGVGAIDLVDADVVSKSNINRQIIALESTVGRRKTDVTAERIKAIDPSISVKCFDMFYLPDNADEIDFSGYDYIVDAIDTTSAKLEIIIRAKKLSIPVITSMGFGNKLDPTKVEIADISKTSVCPLARNMRRLLKDRGITHVKAVYSTEQPTKPACPLDAAGKPTVASVAFVPSVAGLVIASEVIKTLSDTT